MIETKAEKCALCGWGSSVGFNGDDFVRNIKRARCSNPDCEQHFRMALTLDPENRLCLLQSVPIPTVVEWNKLQREIAEGESK